MKKISKVLMLLSMASLVTFTACKKTDDGTTTTTSSTDKISVTITAQKVVVGVTTAITSGVNLQVNDSFIIKAVFKGGSTNKLKSYTVTASNLTALVKSGNLTGTDDSIYFGGYVNLEDTGKTITFIVTLTGEKGDPQTGSFSYNNKGVIYYIDGDAPSLGNQVDAAKKFWSAKRKAVYDLSDLQNAPTVQADVDFAYCSRTTGNLIISPSSQDATDIYSTQWSNQNEQITNWLSENRNTTLMIKVNDAAIIAAYNNPATDIDQLILTALAKGAPNNPTVAVKDGELYLFQTHAQRTTSNKIYGFFKVIQPSGGVSGTPPAATPGTANLVIAYQREQ